MANNNVAPLNTKPARQQQVSNPMDEARIAADRAATEYNKMHSDLIAYKTTNEELRRDNDLLRAEVVRTKQQMESNKEESDAIIKDLKDECNSYLRFGVQMSSQLAFIDKMFKGASETISTAIANAIEASKKSALMQEDQSENNDGAQG